jgi:hypothetical protein
MFCDRCGTQMPAQAAACPSCGRSFVPLMPRQGRIAGHVRLLGILWLAISALRLLPGLFLMALSSTKRFSEGVPLFVPSLLSVIGLIFLIIAGIGIVIGCGLLLRQSWVRMLTILFGAISLIDIPFGTALGIYTLWVLLPAEHEEEYRALSRAAYEAK